jgi:hypothetical protein
MPWCWVKTGQAWPDLRPRAGEQRLLRCSPFRCRYPSPRWRGDSRRNPASRTVDAVHPPRSGDSHDP